MPDPAAIYSDGYLVHFNFTALGALDAGEVE